MAKTKLTAAEQEKIIKENLDLPAIYAAKYRHLMDYYELHSAGNMGLVEGARKFNPTKSSARYYLGMWVNARVMNVLYENRSVHVPFNKINEVIKQNKADFEEAEINVVLPREVSFNKDGDDVAESGCKRDKLEADALKASGDTTSVEAEELKEHIEYMIVNASLSSIEEEALVHRYGLRGQEKKTLKELASLSGYTEMGVLKAQTRALKKLRDCPAFMEVFA